MLFLIFSGNAIFCLTEMDYNSVSCFQGNEQRKFSIITFKNQMNKQQNILNVKILLIKFGSYI